VELVSGVSEILIAANIRESAAGAEAKFWPEEPVTEEHWLLKSVTVKDGHVHGEDWAEKAASHLGNLLASPCARVELAVWRAAVQAAGTRTPPRRRPGS